MCWNMVITNLNVTNVHSAQIELSDSRKGTRGREKSTHQKEK